MNAVEVYRRMTAGSTSEGVVMNRLSPRRDLALYCNTKLFDTERLPEDGMSAVERRFCQVGVHADEQERQLWT